MPLAIPPSAADDIRRAVRAAAARRDVPPAVQSIYDDLAVQVQQRRPVCEMSGRCCRFEDYGHRLYVTTIELAAFARGIEQGGPVPAMQAWDGAGCPFQVSKLCGVHPIRPFGCRIFFCDPTATQWQNDLYERHHATLKRLHEQLDIPYYYLEWRTALRILYPNTPNPAS